MRRREFIVGLGSAVAWPVVGRTQERGMPVIGFLNPNKSDDYPSVIAAFHAGLRELGFVEGDNVKIVYRWAEGHPDRLQALAFELVGIPVQVIAATGGSTANSVKAVTTTIPIVFNSADDPVKTGLVESLNRPEANLTGVSRVSVDLMPKRLELLNEVIPGAAQLSYLVEASSSMARSAVVQQAAKKLGIEIHLIETSREQDLSENIAEAARAGSKGLLIGSSSYFNSRSEQLGELCSRYKLPAIYQGRAFVTAGGLMSYGPSLEDAYRIVGIYTGKVLKGTRPSDLPVQLQTKIDFFINFRTAKTLGLDLAPSLLARADEVIE